MEIYLAALHFHRRPRPRTRTRPLYLDRHFLRHRRGTRRVVQWALALPPPRSLAPHLAGPLPLTLPRPLDRPLAGLLAHPPVRPLALPLTRNF